MVSDHPYRQQANSPCSATSEYVAATDTPKSYDNPPMERLFLALKTELLTGATPQLQIRSLTIY